jgi:hypothetical protein
MNGLRARLQADLGEAHRLSVERGQLACVYLLMGELEKAVGHLEPLLKIPYTLSPGWLKIDPNFDPLRGHPRFVRLVNAQ